MVSQLDDAIYADRYNVANGFFGDYFFYNMNETDTNSIDYSAFALINATS